MAFSGSQKTRLGLSAIPRSVQSFSAKAADAAPTGPAVQVRNRKLLRTAGRMIHSLLVAGFLVLLGRMLH